MRPFFRPLAFLVVGFLWILVAVLTGCTVFVSMTMGHLHGQAIRSIHVHSALVGGVMQIIAGLLLAGRKQRTAQPALFVAFNLGTLGLLIGQALGHWPLMSLAGLTLLGACFPLKEDLIRQAHQSPVSPPLRCWFYGLAMLSLVSGLLVGVAAPLRLIPYALIGQGRLAHIHLLIQGFVLLTLVGAIHARFPTELERRLKSPTLGELTFGLLPLGLVGLLTGFLTAQLKVQIASGAVMLLAALLFGYNILRTWLEASRPRSPASDLYLFAAFYLIVAVASGLAVTVNLFEQPPFVPFGPLHLAAYTHLAFIGFILLSLLGTLTDLLPPLAAEERMRRDKERGPYAARLARILGQWTRFQLWTISLGTMGLALTAALLWQYPLKAWPVVTTAWASALSLVTGFASFAVQVIRVLIEDPQPAAQA
jgi:hypothetical protein